MLEPGLSATASLVVGDRDLAAAMGSGDVPVLATPRIVALCEEATVAATRGRLEPGTTTVGTRVEIDHLAATPSGAAVQATAVLETVDGHLLRFRVTVTGAGREVAAGAVDRAVVYRDAFVARAER